MQRYRSFTTCDSWRHISLQGTLKESEDKVKALQLELSHVMTVL
jgi:hypothetical protein